MPVVVTWRVQGLRDLAETHEQVNEASDVLMDDGAAVFRSLESAVEILDELVDARAIDWPPAEGALAAWNRLISILQTVRVAVLAATTAGHVEENIRGQLGSAATKIDRTLFEFLTTYKDELVERASAGPTRDDATRVIDRAAERIAAQRLITEAREVRDKVNRVLGETQRAAGVVGETVLATHFARYARRERRSANLLRWASIVLVLAITGIAGVLLFKRTGANLTTARELSRLAVLLPPAALAAYLARESARHRTTSTWADELEIQLLTIDAYCEPLADESRAQLRSEFGRRVFLTNGALAGVPDELGPSSTATATALLEQAMSVLRTSAK